MPAVSLKTQLLYSSGLWGQILYISGRWDQVLFNSDLWSPTDEVTSEDTLLDNSVVWGLLLYNRGLWGQLLHIRSFWGHLLYHTVLWSRLLYNYFTKVGPGLATAMLKIEHSSRTRDVSLVFVFGFPACVLNHQMIFGTPPLRHVGKTLHGQVQRHNVETTSLSSKTEYYSKLTTLGAIFNKKLFSKIYNF